MGASDHETGKKCPSCGRTWYRNSAPTAGCVIVRDGKALVTQRGVEPEKGRFDIPGGFLAAGEEPISGLKRELREELGVEVDASVEDCLSMVPHPYGPEGDYVLALGFVARLVSGEPRAADDVADFLWVDEDELEALDFAWPHDRELVRKALRRAKEGMDGGP
ncbi:MAG: NUDIX hydrolase [Actinomycetota bacterium]